MWQDKIQSLLHPIAIRGHNRSTILGLLAKHSVKNAVIYDVGCGNKPFASDVRKMGCEYIGVDIEEGFYDEPPDIIGSATNIPVPDQVADIVISSQVLEHLERPLDALKEAIRILKPGGVMLCSFPFLYPLHATPHDFGRYTRFFILYAAKQLEFEILSEQSLSGYWKSQAVGLSLYLQSFNKGPLKYIGLVTALSALHQWFCYGVDYVERIAFRLAGKNPDPFQQTWPINYVFVLKKRHDMMIDQ